MPKNCSMRRASLLKQLQLALVPQPETLAERHPSVRFSVPPGESAGQEYREREVLAALDRAGTLTSSAAEVGRPVRLQT